MAANSIIYANARVSANVCRMLTGDKLQRLIDCAAPSEALKYLNECGFEGDTLDALFKNEYDAIYSFMEETAPVPKIREAFLKRNDYRNAKILVKCKYTRREADKSLLFSYGNISVDKLKDYILSDTYAFLPDYMRRALEEIDTLFAQGERTGKTVDCLLTGAMYGDMLECVKGYGKMSEVIKAEVDMNNLSMTYRVKKYSLGEGALEKEYIEGGKISLAELKKSLSSSEEDALKIFGVSPYLDIIKYLSNESASAQSTAGFEKLRDNYFVNLYKTYKADMSDYMMFYGYIYCRQIDLKNIRIACNLIKSGAAKEDIRSAMRELYVQ